MLTVYPRVARHEPLRPAVTIAEAVQSAVTDVAYEAEGRLERLERRVVQQAEVIGKLAQALVAVMPEDLAEALVDDIIDGSRFVSQRS